MEQITHLYDKIGRAQIMAAFEVGPRVLQHHAALGVLPSTWFAGMEALAGEPLPRQLFSFKAIAP